MSGFNNEAVDQAFCRHKREIEFHFDARLWRSFFHIRPFAATGFRALQHCRLIPCAAWSSKRRGGLAPLPDRRRTHYCRTPRARWTRPCRTADPLDRSAARRAVGRNTGRLRLNGLPASVSRLLLHAAWPLGWGVPVHGVSSLALVAAGQNEPALTVAVEGGHGEGYIAGLHAHALLPGWAHAVIDALSGGANFDQCLGCRQRHQKDS